MIAPDFAQGIKPDTAVIQALESVHQTLCATDASIILREKYETLFGIYNHANADPARPLASMAMHWMEDATLHSPLYERIQQFRRRKIAQWFGISLPEFLELPSDICRTMMEEAGIAIEEEAKITTQLANQISSAAGKPGDKS